MSPDTSQVLFRSEYEQELETWLRRRFGYLCIAYVVLEAILLINQIVGAVWPPESLRDGSTIFALAAIRIGGALVALLVTGHFLFVRRKLLETREEVLRAATQLILSLGAISLLSRILSDRFQPSLGDNVYFSLFFWHFTACMFLPWTPRESLRPMLPLLLAWDVWLLLTRVATEPSTTVLHIVFNPGVLIPGLGICAWRLNLHTQSFRDRMVGKQFLTMRQEFMRARSVHESMFPVPYDDGFVRFDYTYTPMRELGGDFIHFHVTPQGIVHATLIDVTGHGLTAALTVNRLYGEIERIRAESPRAEPGEMLGLLNRYIFLTMARHQIYATALALMLDPYEGQVRWAGAGHPPALLRGANGVVTPLPSTSMMLGILDDDQYDRGQKSIELSPGDVLVVYTDGAFEARDRRGTRFGLEQLQHVLHRQPPPRNWPQFISSFVSKHAAGRIDDDVLIASLTYNASRRPATHAEPSLAAS